MLQILGASISTAAFSTHCAGVSAVATGLAVNLTAPLFTGPVTEWVEEQKRYETMPPHDPFSFMLNHYCSIDDNNSYVEEFDTLDGVHWEIAVDVADHLLEMLDEGTKDE